MKSYSVQYLPRAAKALQKLDRATSILIYTWIEKNLVDCVNPRVHGKALTANRSGQWRYRVGDYRLIAEINDDTITILILSIGHRSEVYS